MNKIDMFKTVKVVIYTYQECIYEAVVYNMHGYKILYCSTSYMSCSPFYSSFQDCIHPYVYRLQDFKFLCNSTNHFC